MKAVRLNCPSCGGQAAPDTKWCAHCGTRLVVVDENRHTIVHDEAAETARFAAGLTRNSTLSGVASASGSIYADPTTLMVGYARSASARNENDGP